MNKFFGLIHIPKVAFALSYIKLSRPYSLFWFIIPYFVTDFYSISTILFLCFYVFLLYVFILLFYFLRVVGPRDLVFMFLVYFWLKVDIGPYGPVVTTSLFHGENEGSSPSGGVTTLKTIGVGVGFSIK